ncbi:hypothetical protein MUK42_04231, partial [Musa troglodytarum]
QPSRCSIVVSIPACHAGDPGSIPGNGVNFLLFCQKAQAQQQQVRITSPRNLQIVDSWTIKRFPSSSNTKMTVE